MKLKPEFYVEQPERELIEGHAVQLSNNDEVAFEIAKWLNDQGIVAWVTPSVNAAYRAAYLRIPEARNRPGFGGEANRKDAFPEDWIIVQTWSTGRKQAFIVTTPELLRFFTKR